MQQNRNKTARERRVVIFKVWCTAPDIVFELDPGLVDDVFLRSLRGRALPCEGGDHLPGWHCRGCPYAEWDTEAIK